MRSYQVDMCNGPIFKKLIIFSLPLILSGCLQLLFNAADIIVVGRFTGNQALAAVGSTSALINLLVNMFMGLEMKKIHLKLYIQLFLLPSLVDY